MWFKQVQQICHDSSEDRKADKLPYSAQQAAGVLCQPQIPIDLLGKKTTGRSVRCFINRLRGVEP